MARNGLANLRMYQLLLTLLFCFQISGHDLNIVFSGELTLSQAIPDVISSANLKPLHAEVLSKISNNIIVGEECLEVEAEFRASAENSSVSIANYTVTIDESKCDMARETLTLDNMSELGVNSFHINPDMNVQSQFWRDKMNSILIFAGCGVLIIIVLVTCIVLTTRCHLYNMPHHSGEGHTSSTSSKQQLYQPYCVDTMTMDLSHSKQKRKEKIINEQHQEPTTIQRWVNSQLKGKGKRTSQNIELDHDMNKSRKTSNQHPDVFNTDSGIVTTAPRRHHRGSVYDVEEAKLTVAQGQEGVYKRRSSFDEPLVVDNIYEQCEADYAQHDNDAYNSDHSQANTSSNGEDSAIEEQSSKL